MGSEQNYIEKIVGFYKRQKRMPSYSEIATLCGFKSKNAVFRLVEKLVEAGRVGKDSKGKLFPHKLFGEIPMLGLVEAGFPSAAEEEMTDTLSLDDYMIEKKESSYMLRVKGDSMIDAGIREGDLVIVERGGEPRDGDIVIAEVDGGWTMKYLRTKNGKRYLEPANKDFKNIYPENDMRIAAVVKGVVRKY